MIIAIDGPAGTGKSTIASILAEKLNHPIPQRWSIAHLYQAVLNGEEHVAKIAHITTLAGYVHFMLTGVNAVGIGEASGIFPIDSKDLDYDKKMMQKFCEPLKIPCRWWAMKPISRKLTKVMADYGFEPSETIMLGDKLSTDVLAAHFAGIHAWKVDHRRDIV